MSEAANTSWGKGFEGQRKADLGNGFYLNPIMPGDHPDPSILKDGEDYYLTLSSFDAYPGLPIWHSRDLVNWQPLGHAITTNVGAIWAPDIIKHGSRYFIYFPARTGESRSNFVVWADDIKGPWSEPIDIGLSGWYALLLFPSFIIYAIAMVGETNRAPFDMAEGESEIVGYHVEYSGMAFAVFQLAEYSAMILCSTMVSLVFLGGWLSPVAFLPDSAFWLFAKISSIIFFFFWIRATFPRYRYDQIMRLGWKVFIPVCLVWLLVVGCWMMSPWNIWK